MGKGARNRQRKAAAGKPLPVIGSQQIPDGIAWTPIEQLCGCVIEWGWHGESNDPMSFMQSVAKMPLYPCAWHGSETGRPVPLGRSEPFVFTNGGQKPFFYVNRATGDRISLGQRIARELKRVMALTEDEQRETVERMHPDFVRQLQADGIDPFSAWMDQRLTDLLLNQNPGQGLAFGA